MYRVPHGKVWSIRGRIVSISQKLVVMLKIIRSQDCKTTFKQNLTCIFLPVRANLKYTLCHEGPCMYYVVVGQFLAWQCYIADPGPSWSWFWNSFTSYVCSSLAARAAAAAAAWFFVLLPCQDGLRKSRLLPAAPRRRCRQRRRRFYSANTTRQRHWYSCHIGPCIRLTIRKLLLFQSLTRPEILSMYIRMSSVKPK